MEQPYCPYCMSAVDELGQCAACGRWNGGYQPLSHHLPLYTVLNGRFLVGGALGSGGFGITYVGRDLRLGNRVAIKEYFPIDQATRSSSGLHEVTLYSGVDRKDFEADRAGFLREARALAAMEKQQVIVGIRDYFEENGTAYLVMEYVEGTTLESLAKRRGGRIAPTTLFSQLRPLLTALSELHEHGLIHRDITPDNIMLENGHVRLIDFGCARERSDTRAMTATLKGGYAPIEQYSGCGQGPWTDVYSVCATIYRCVTGLVPASALERLAVDSIVPPRKLGIRIPEQQERALMCGLRIKPTQRFQTVSLLEEALFGSNHEAVRKRSNGTEPQTKDTSRKETGMGYAEVKSQGDKILRDVEECALLVGPEGTGVVVDGVVAGIDGMETMAKALSAAADGLKKSKFVMLFMGTFNNGKSTTINALLGARRLPVRMTEATAVISRVTYGEDEDTVTIHYSDGKAPRTITSEQFLKEFVLTAAEKAIVKDGGSLDRFEDVAYTQLYSSDEVYRSGVELVDSPGLGASVQTEQRTRDFMREANAVVVLLDATHLFSDKERGVIQRLFINRAQMPRNVFFLVNRINMLEDEADRRDVCELAEETLAPVFTRSGEFDEDLMHKRLFYVDSKGALELRERGEEPKGEYVEAFYRFQQALEEYLTSKDRVLDMYRPSLVCMAAAYVEAKENVQRTRVTLKAKPQEQRVRAEQCQAKLDDLQKDVNKMATEVRHTRDVVTLKVMNSLQQFLSQGLIDAWPEAAEQFDEKFGITDMVKLALPLSGERKKELLSPMSDYIENFVLEQILSWTDGIEMLISSDMDQMQEELDAQGNEFRLGLTDIMNQFGGGYETEWEGKPNPVQMALSLIQGDVSVAVENAAGGNFSWGEFVKRYLKQAVINIAIYVFAGGGLLGIIVAVLAELIGMKMHAKSRAQGLLNSFAEQIFLQIKTEVLTKQPEIEAAISTRFADIESSIVSTSLGQIEDERKRQASIMEKLELAEDEVRKEVDRQDNVLDRLMARVGHTYSLLYENLPSAEEILALAGATGKNL